MNKQEAIELLRDVANRVFYRTGRRSVHIDEIVELIKQIDEPKKHKVPQVAVEFYEKYKDKFLTLDEWFSYFYSKEAIDDFPRMEELTDWLYDNDNKTNGQRELALATLVTLGIDAVEIEKEKLYTVEIPNPNNIGAERTVLMKNGFNQIVMLRVYDHSDNWRTVKGYQLTETEIKKDFEWAWQFAEEVK